MNENKIVIFDWGGVIDSHNPEDYNVDKAIVNLLKKLGCKYSDEEILKKYENCFKNSEGYFLEIFNDEKNILEWYARLTKELEIECGFEEYCQLYKEEFLKIDFYKDVVDLAHSLKKYCKIGILSNLLWIDKERLNNQVDLNKFDYVWLSFELNTRKPEREIYNIVEKQCNINPKNILFIDDYDININKANEMGWNTCMAKGNEIEKIKDSIKKFLNE